MSVPNKLGIAFTPTEITDMKTAAQTIIDTINNKIVLNLSEDERKSLSKVGPERWPYVFKSVSDYSVSFPQFNPLAYSLADVSKDGDTYTDLGQVLTLLNEAIERVEEVVMTAGHFMFLFMRKQYELAESNRGENVPGAQTVYDGLKGAFEGQGNFGTPGGPPTP
jgi:hypothetical protein